MSRCVEALRVVLADDNYLVREGIAALLAECPDVELVAAVADPPSLMKAITQERPRAVLVDIRMPPTHTNEGIVAAKQIRAQHPEIGVVVLSQYVEQAHVLELLADGVAGLGYLLKDHVSDLDELVRALREVARGGSILDPTVVENLLSHKAAESASPLARLTDRELEVLREMASGKTNATIAKTLFMSDRAVEKHIGTVFQKLGLADEGEINRRVVAVLAFLDATGGNSR